MMWRSSTLWLFGLTLGLAAGGCVDSDGDDATMSLAWDVAYVGNGALVSCKDAGTPLVRLDAVSQRTGEAFAFEFDCDRKRGVTPPVPRGWYDVTLSLLDAMKRPVAATAGAFEVRRHGTAFLDPVEFQVLAWQVSWGFSLERAGAGIRTANCEEVGVATVEFITQQASEAAQSYAFDCRFGFGITAAIRAGSYVYQLRLLNAAGQVIDETEPESLLVPTTTAPAVSQTFRFKQ